MKPQFLIGGMTTLSGKTIFSLGMLRALKKKGIKVQSYKCGADFLDLQLHCISSGTDSVSLDSWYSGRTHLQHVYNKYGEKADVCLVEGNAGLFDGYKRMQGSSAEMSMLLSIPVILVINARQLSYSVAPILYGFKHFTSKTRIVGVVFTHVSSEVHYSHLKDGCTDAGMSCLGYIPYDEKLRLPSKHSSLTQTARNQLEDVIELSASYILQNVDIDRILRTCTRIFPCEYTLPYTSDVVEEYSIPRYFQSFGKIRIAIARDAAFNFLYKENLDKLAETGSINYFSPLYGKEMPQLNPATDILYLPGGFPELFARQLYRRKNFLSQIKEYADAGGKIFAEGGGISLLCDSLSVRDGGSKYQMSGVLPMEFTMKDSKPVVGYRVLGDMASGDKIIKGYEFRYSRLEYDINDLHNRGVSLIPINNTRGNDVSTYIYRYKNVVAGLPHWYWGESDFLNFWD